LRAVRLANPKSITLSDDFLPTVLEYLGLPPLREEEAVTLPGRSFAPLLRGQPEATGAGQRAAVVYDEYGRTRMLRTRDWKYVHRYPDGPHELYHLEADAGEASNLVADAAHAGKLRELRGQLERWFAAHVEPALDGAALPVTGDGQRRPVGRADSFDDSRGVFGKA